MALVEARVTIRGFRPLLFHKFGRDAIPLEKQVRTGVAGNDPEEWRRTAMINRRGQLYILPTYIFASIVEGARNTKSGRAGLDGKMRSTLQCVDSVVLIDRYFPGWPSEEQFNIDEVNPPSEDPEEPVYLDVTGVVNKMTKGRNVRYRIAAAPGWQATFNIQYDNTVISPTQMAAILIDSGKLAGVGDGRKIGMGRYEIVEHNIALR